MIKNFLINTLAVAIVFYILPTNVVGSTYLEKGISILVISLIIAALNMTVKPIIKIISLPVNIVTLGLFSIIINAIIIKIADVLSPSFAMSGFVSYIIFGLLLSVIQMLLSVFRDGE